MRVRGLKLVLTVMVYLMLVSHPMRVRGLKLRSTSVFAVRNKSHPMRVRGLKHDFSLDHFKFKIVAPHAGAWIETL